MNDDLRSYALCIELDTSIRLIKIGFGEYQKLDTVNDFYFLPFLLISNGLERLMKCYVCLGYFARHNSYPNSNFLLNLGHDLNKLKEHILENYYDIGNKQALIDDFEYLNMDYEIERILGLLSDFGTIARYDNLNIITGNIKKVKNTETEWKSYEFGIAKADKNINNKITDIKLQKQVHDYIEKFIIIKLEKFVRAITRQFTFGNVSKVAKEYSPIVKSFINLTDDKLGLTNYS